mgnify:FL=1
MMPRKGKGQKVSSASGQTYGDRVAQEEAQKAMPLPERPRITPGAAGSLTRPSEQPRQPLTAGLPMGAGAGPESLIRPAPKPSPVISESLGRVLPLLISRAEMPDASSEFRQFVRKARQLAADSPNVY